MCLRRLAHGRAVGHGPSHPKSLHFVLVGSANRFPYFVLRSNYPKPTMKTAAITLVLFCLVASSVQFVLRSEFEDDALIGFESYMRNTRDASSSESSEEKDVKSVVEGSGEEEELKLVFKREAITDTVEVEASGEEPATVETRFKREAAVVEGSGEEARFRREADLVAEASGEEPALL